MLNSLITIQQRESGKDVAGQRTQSWVNFTTVWGEIAFPSGLQAIRGGEPVSIAKASIKVRLRSDLTADMRALCGTQVFDIKAVLPNMVNRKYMFLACEVSK